MIALQPEPRMLAPPGVAVAIDIIYCTPSRNGLRTVSVAGDDAGSAWNQPKSG